MDTKMSEWEEDKDVTADQVRAMVLDKYNNILTSERWSNKDPKYAQILALVGVNQNLVENSKKSFEKSNTFNMESTKGEPAYIRDLPNWMLEEPK